MPNYPSVVYKQSITTQSYSLKFNISLDTPQPSNNVGDGPEAPEVKTITEYLHNHVAGLTLLSIEWDNKSKINPSQQSNWGLYILHSPYQVTAVTCHGKNIFFNLQSLRDNYKMYIHSHLCMTGSWLLEPTNTSHLWLQFGQAVLLPHNYLSLQHLNMYFDEERPLGIFKLLTTEEYLHKLSKLGPDLLSGNVTYELWYSIISKHSKMHIVSFLINHQSYIAGIGNYLKSEILYRARISPRRKIESLTAIEHQILYTVAIATIRESYQKGGLTIKNYKDPEGRKGQFVVIVYGKKAGEKDPNGYNIIKEKLADGRSTYWVPQWQI